MVKKIDKRSKIAVFGGCETGSNPVTPTHRKPLEINGFLGFLLVFWAFFDQPKNNAFITFTEIPCKKVVKSGQAFLK